MLVCVLFSPFLFPARIKIMIVWWINKHSNAFHNSLVQHTVPQFSLLAWHFSIRIKTTSRRSKYKKTIDSRPTKKSQSERPPQLQQHQVLRQTKRRTKQTIPKTTRPPATAEDSTSGPTAQVNPPVACFGAAMGRPGQPGALYFDKYNISEFLRRWDIECEDYGLTGPQNCQRVGDYCSPEIKDVIELLPGYDENDWTVLQQQLKNTYWQHDKQLDTMAKLNQLFRAAPNLDLNVFLLKYAATSATLISKGPLSPLDRVGHLLDGLSVELRRKVVPKSPGASAHRIPFYRRPRLR
jgi:hypothetical protein